VTGWKYTHHAHAQIEKMLLKNKKALILITSLLVVAIIVAAIGVSLALWRDQPDTSGGRNVNTGDWNASASGQVFQALDEQGNPITPDTFIDIKAFALVGYTGLEKTIFVLSTITVEVGGVKLENLPVTKIMSPDVNRKFYRNGGEFSPGDTFVGFTGNEFIEEIVVPDTVTLITNTVFAHMAKLNKVVFDDSPNGSPPSDWLCIRPFAFLGSSLVTYGGDRHPSKVKLSCSGCAECD
jgi:hypothetical protein